MQASIIGLFVFVQASDTMRHHQFIVYRQDIDLLAVRFPSPFHSSFVHIRNMIAPHLVPFFITTSRSHSNVVHIHLIYPPIVRTWQNILFWLPNSTSHTLFIHSANVTREICFGNETCISHILLVHGANIAQQIN